MPVPWRHERDSVKKPMGVSFKVSKFGTRFRPKPFKTLDLVHDLTGNFATKSNLAIHAIDDSSSATNPRNQSDISLGIDDFTEKTTSYIASEGFLSPAGIEVSFIVNLFLDGYSITKPLEIDRAQQSEVQDAPKLLRSYDRLSESLFSAIESGRLPGDILDDMPCKYVDGTVLCEVRDYRKCSREQPNCAPPTDESPIINKISLRMSLENVVKDIPLISNSSWTYGDLMEVESRILKALQPKLCLDPTPKLDRLSHNPNLVKLDLDISSLRKKRLRRMTEVTVTSNHNKHEEKACIDKVQEISNGRLGDSIPVSSDMISQHIHENLNAQGILQGMSAMRPKSMGPDTSVSTLPSVSHPPKIQSNADGSRIFQDHGPGLIVTSSGGPLMQDNMIPYTVNMNTSALMRGKRDRQESSSSLNKRTRVMPTGSDSIQQQQIAQPHMDGLIGSDIPWKNTFLQLANTRGFQYGNKVFQESGSASFSGQKVIGYGLKQEPIELDKLDTFELNQGKSNLQYLGTETNPVDLQQSQYHQKVPQQSLIRSTVPHMSWSNLSQHIEKDLRDEQAQKMKSIQSPRASAGASVQSPLSSKSGEFSTGSFGKRDKSAVTSVYPGYGMGSMNSYANDSMQWQHQTQVGAKWRSNSLPKTPGTSVVGSPASVSNIVAPFNSSSPPVGTLPLVDQTMIDRFSKIEMVSMRYQLNRKKNKAGECPMRKPNTYTAHHLSHSLSLVSNSDDIKDDTCLRPFSKSIVGGSINSCKMRVISFVQTERILQGDSVSVLPKSRTRMIMSEKINDGTIAMHYGDMELGDFLAAEDYLPTLPNTNSADLLAAQLCSLMVRDGHVVEDHVQPKPVRVNPVNAPMNTNNTVAEMRQCAEPISGHPSNEMSKLDNSGNNVIMNSFQSGLTSTMALSSGHPQFLQMSQDLLHGISLPLRSQQLDSQISLHQQHQTSMMIQPQHQNQASVIHQQSNQASMIQQQQQQNSMIQQQQQNQHPQFQRSPLMHGSSHPLSQLNATSNMQLGSGQMINKTQLQYQLLQQQQRKLMMGMGTGVGMGNIGNNMVGLGGLGNVMGIGNSRGISGTGMSAPMGLISGLDNVSHNPMNVSQASSINAISQQLRSGQLTPGQQTSMALRLKSMQSRGAMSANPQLGMSGMPGGGRQMNPGSSSLSMLRMNRASMGSIGNMGNITRSSMGPMGPPKVMSGMNGMNVYMNQQQQQFQLQQLQQQHQQQFQQLQQQQETASTLQGVVSPQQIGSPSNMGIQQQMCEQTSPQQMGQRTPMSPPVSSGGNGMHQLSNTEACPPSPQLSSQTLGSVGSIANSPMDSQPVSTKGNSINIPNTNSPML